MMILRKELAASYCWLLILVTCFKEGSLQSVVINYPHYPVYGHNSYQSWNGKEMYTLTCNNVTVTTCTCTCICIL